MRLSYGLRFLALAAVVVLNASLVLAQVTRIEQDDPSIAYSGDWYSNSGDANSGGTAALTNARGARAVINFTGTGINWIGLKEPWSGMANVYLDGVLNIVDAYADETLYQQALFTVSDLEAGPHNLTIEITHERDVNGLGSWVWIDAFEVQNGAPVSGGIVATAGRIEQNNPSLIYGGSWVLNESAVHSGGSAVLSTDGGSRVTITFEGTGISWISYRDEWSGIANVYLDGEMMATIDTYLSPYEANTVAYSIGGLAAGPHSLTIEVTGAHNDASGGSWIWLDAFDVIP